MPTGIENFAATVKGRVVKNNVKFFPDTSRAPPIIYVIKGSPINDAPSYVEILVFILQLPNVFTKSSL